jgi:uncharacterized cysteine cluster protein YcgN (CxxCxxCC family)
MPLEADFWKDKPLCQLSDEEWEALCDGCGKCCLHKLEDEDTGVLYFTDVACHLLDVPSCRCRDYDNRHRRVPDCLKLNPLETETFRWLPRTCAYRLRWEGKPLPPWHPLLSGDPSTVMAAMVSVSPWAVSETDLAPDTSLEDRIVSDEL